MLEPFILASFAALGIFAITICKCLVDLSRLKQKNDKLDTMVDQLKELVTSLSHDAREHLLMQFNMTERHTFDRFNQLKDQIQLAFSEHRTKFDEKQTETFKQLFEALHKIGLENRQELRVSLLDSTKEMGEKIKALTLTTENQLKDIHYQVEKRLSDGFVKTNETFNRVIERLALIDAAQRKITELSGNIMSLQEVLNDKRSRGAFGEVQLSALIYNMIPEQNVAFQYTLANGKRADCMLKLPPPTGNIIIDAKFPLENFRIMIASTTLEAEKQQAERQFKIDIRKHIQDIAEKYIVPPETADGAIMFIPSESVFAEIHARYGDLVEYAQQQKVWLVSPTTLMAVLTTARAVLKDAATRKQMHEIQTHLRFLAEDFDRFQIRMDNLAKRIAQAHADAELIHISSKKISQRFSHIERTEFDALQDIPADESDRQPLPVTATKEQEPSLIMGNSRVD